MTEERRLECLNEEEGAAGDVDVGVAALDEVEYCRCWRMIGWWAKEEADELRDGTLTLEAYALWKFSLSERPVCDPPRGLARDDDGPVAIHLSPSSSKDVSPPRLKIYNADDGRDERPEWCCPGTIALFDLAVACEWERLRILS